MNRFTMIQPRQAWYAFWKYHRETENERLRFLVQGFSNKKIAGLMKICPGTVNTHLDNIYSKLGCSNRLTTCFTALKNGLFLPTCEVYKL